MLRPNQLKYNKERKGRIRGQVSKIPTLAPGNFALKSLECGRISARQIEATRRVITRNMKRRGQVWVRIFPSKGITSKPIEVRMGKGKGSVEYWVSSVKKGKVLFEVGGVSSSTAIKALKDGASKLPVLTKIIT